MLTQEDDYFSGNGSLDLLADPQLIEAFEIGPGGESVLAVIGGDQRNLAAGAIDCGYSDTCLVTFKPGSPGYTLTIRTRKILFISRLGRARDDDEQCCGRESREHTLG